MVLSGLLPCSARTQNGNSKRTPRSISHVCTAQAEAIRSSLLPSPRLLKFQTYAVEGGRRHFRTLRFWPLPLSSALHNSRRPNVVVLPPPTLLTLDLSFAHVVYISVLNARPGFCVARLSRFVFITDSHNCSILESVPFSCSIGTSFFWEHLSWCPRCSSPACVLRDFCGAETESVLPDRCRCERVVWAEKRASLEAVRRSFWNKVSRWQEMKCNTSGIVFFSDLSSIYACDLFGLEIVACSCL